MNAFKSYLRKTLFTLVTLLFFFLLFELVVFRFVLVATDMPELDYVNGVVKYKPDQRGIYRVKNEIKSRYRINSSGWNSGHDKYHLDRKVNKHLVAIVGDSIVDALQVDYEQSVAENLEDMLGSESFQVYRFGLGGAPMSQYLHVLRTEVLPYSPALVIIIIIHNDFDKSYKLFPGVYESSFLKVRIHDGYIASEIEPERYQSAWYTGFRESATWRYLAYRQKMQFQLLRDIVLGKRYRNIGDYQANIDISTLSEDQWKNEVLADYIFRQLGEICIRNGSELLILMNGDIPSLQEGIDSAQLYKSGALRLNVMSRLIAKKHNINFIDLHPKFEQDFVDNRQRLNFISDGHWNEYTHEFVARIIYERMISNFKFTTSGKLE